MTVVVEVVVVVVVVESVCVRRWLGGMGQGRDWVGGGVVKVGV